MSTDGDLSKGSGTGDGPDEFDSVVLDENFIRGGVSETSLRRYQVVRDQKWERPRRPVDRMPGSSSDSAGAQRAAAPQDPTPSDQHRTHPAEDVPGHLGTGERFSASGFESRRPRATGMILGAAALVVALVVLSGLIGLGRGSAGSTGTSNLPVAAQAGPGSQAGVTLNPSMPLGTCFNLPNDTTSSSMTIDVQSCGASHAYELVDLQQGTGANDQYPTQASLSSAVNGQCSNDLQTYTGRSNTNWTNSLYPAVIPPTQAGWAKGERTIYCIAVLTPSVTGTVRGLGDASPTASG